MGIKKDSTQRTTAHAKPSGGTEKGFAFTKGTSGPSSASMKAVGRNMARANNQKGGK